MKPIHEENIKNGDIILTRFYSRHNHVFIIGKVDSIDESNIKGDIYVYYFNGRRIHGVEGFNLKNTYKFFLLSDDEIVKHVICERI